MIDLEQNSGLYYASSDKTALELAELMLEKKIGLLPIVDDSRLVGVVSERDLVVHVLAAGKEPNQVRASDIMTPDPMVADAKDSWEVILGKMKHVHARHMVVVSDGILVGVLSLRDFLMANIDAKQVEVKKAYDVVYVNTKTEPSVDPLDAAAWSCTACGFLDFGTPRPEKCPSCGVSGTFQGDDDA